MSWGLFWVALGAVVTAVAGVAPVALHVSVMWSVVAVLVAAVVAALLLGWVVADDLATLSNDQFRTAMTLLRIAVALHAVAAVAIQLRPQWWLYWPLVIGGMAAAEYGVAQMYQRLATRPRPASVAARRAAMDQDREATADEKKVDWVMKEIDHPKVQARRDGDPFEPILDDSGKVIGHNIYVMLPEGKVR